MFRSAQFTRSALRQVQATATRRGFASPSAGGGSSSNLPVILGGLGLVGLGSYVYLDKNPSVIAAIDANAKEAAGRAEDAAQNARDMIKAGGAAVSANAHELVGEAKDKAQKVKDGVNLADEAHAAGQPADLKTLTALIKDQWVDFKLENVEKYNDNTSIYTFSFPSPDMIAGGEVASALVVKASDPEALRDDKGKPVIRPYTPITANDTPGQLKLMVKTYPDGKMSQHIAHLNKGDALSFKGPIQKFKYKPNQFEHGVCVAGGSGVTPMYQMISHAMKQPGDKTKFTLIFANQTEKDILLRKEFDELAKKNPERLEVVYTLDKPGYFWKGESGFVSKEMLEKYAPKREGNQFFVCGPPGQVKAICGAKDGMKQGAVSGALGELGYTNENVFKF